MIDWLYDNVGLWQTFILYLILAGFVVTIFLKKRFEKKFPTDDEKENL